MEELLLREVRFKDREGIVSVIRRCANLTDEEKNCAAELLDIYLSEKGQKDYFFIAAFLEDGRAAGYVCYGNRALAKGVYDLYWILVDPALRGRGVGGALIERTAEILDSGRARMLIAETSGLESYKEARAFYLRSGFREEARIREFYKEKDDLIIYVRRF